MRTHLVRRTSAAVVFLLSSALCAAQQQEYEIKLHRNAVVGQKHLLVASATQSQSRATTMDGQAGPSQEMSVTAEITAHLTTLAVTAVGKESKVSLLVDKSQCSVDGVAGEIAVAGTTIVATRNAETTSYLVGSLPLNGRAAKCLNLVVPLSGSEKTTDDLVFGTQARQKVGGEWPMNSAAAADDFSKNSGMTVAAADLTGSTKLLEVASFNNQPSLRLAGDLVIKNVGVPLPPGLSVKTSEFKATLNALLPIDVTRNDAQTATMMTGRIECEGTANGHSVRLVMTMSQRMDQTFTIES